MKNKTRQEKRGSVLIRTCAHRRICTNNVEISENDSACTVSYAEIAHDELAHILSGSIGALGVERIALGDLLLLGVAVYRCRGAEKEILAAQLTQLLEKSVSLGNVLVIVVIGICDRFGDDSQSGTVNGAANIGMLFEYLFDQRKVCDISFVKNTVFSKLDSSGNQRIENYGSMTTIFERGTDGTSDIAGTTGYKNLHC